MARERLLPNIAYNEPIPGKFAELRLLIWGEFVTFGTFERIRTSRGEMKIRS